MSINRKLYIASSNPGKVAEMVELVKEFFPEFIEIIPRAPKNANEIESTFRGNAAIKSQAQAAELIEEKEIFPFCVLADDSGIEVNALGGQPGVRSARYAGDHVATDAHIQKLLKDLEQVADEDRDCRYTCALNLELFWSPTERSEWRAEGHCHGLVLKEAKGCGGFGYDPIFYSPDLGQRMSEASLEKKNKISHRRRAFEVLAESFKSNLAP